MNLLVILSYFGPHWAELSEKILPGCSPACMHNHLNVLLLDGYFGVESLSFSVLSSTIIIVNLVCSRILTLCPGIHQVLKISSSVALLSSAPSPYPSQANRTHFPEPQPHAPHPSQRDSQQHPTTREITFPAFRSASSWVLRDATRFFKVFKPFNHWWRCSFTNFSDTFYSRSRYIKIFTQYALIQLKNLLKMSQFLRPPPQKSWDFSPKKYGLWGITGLWVLGTKSLRTNLVD